MPKFKPFKGIVKVQLSIIPRGSVLVYGEDHEILYGGRATKDIIKLIDPDEMKGYFYAHTNKNKMLEIDKPAPWQDW